MSKSIVPFNQRKLTGAELEFFERVTTELVAASGGNRNRFKNYRLGLKREGFEQLMRAIVKCGGKLEVPEFEPTWKERE